MLKEAIKFITNVFSENKRAKEFKDDFITAVIDWIEPWFLTTDEKLAEEIKEQPEEDKTQMRLEIRLEEMLENDDFKAQLEAFMNKPEGQILRKKNVFDGEIGDVEGSLKIGDSTTEADSQFDEKNVFRGKAGKIGGDFQLGDG